MVKIVGPQNNLNDDERQRKSEGFLWPNIHLATHRIPKTHIRHYKYQIKLSDSNKLHTSYTTRILLCIHLARMMF